MSRVRLLVSVRDATEALAALEGGADIIDVKEPARGALGRADAAAMAAVVKAVAGRRPVSAAVGELMEFDNTRMGHHALPSGINFAKMGLADAPSDWPQRLAGYFAGVPGIRPIAVAYADGSRAKSPRVDEVLDWAIQNHAAGLLIDTFGKDGSSLLDWMEGDQLSAAIVRCRDAGLMIALAGSLHGESFRCAAALKPDIVAVRAQRARATIATEE